jgi:hypothetical protein
LHWSREEFARGQGAFFSPATATGRLLASFNSDKLFTGKVLSYFERATKSAAHHDVRNLFPKLFRAKREAPRQYGVHDQPDCGVSKLVVTVVEIKKDLQGKEQSEDTDKHRHAGGAALQRVVHRDQVSWHFFPPHRDSCSVVPG